MKLYRGDSIPRSLARVAREKRGSTFADHFCSNGLTAKYAGNCSGTLLHGKELLDMVLSHVGYVCSESEHRFSYHSPFLSFTQEESEAFSFAERTGTKILEECNLEDASYFVWELDLDLPPEVERGRYKFLYNASSKNCEPLVAGQIQRGLEREAACQDYHQLVMGIMNLGAMCIANSDPSDHRAELIDVQTYVQNHCGTIHRDTHLVSRTLERAGRSREWLLYPTDPMEEGPGLSTRFAMNRHLRVHHCYRVRSGLSAAT